MNAPISPPVSFVLAPLSNTAQWQTYFVTGALDRVAARDLIAAYDARQGAATYVALALYKYLLTVIIRNMERPGGDLASPHKLEEEIVATLALDLNWPQSSGGRKLRNNFVRHVKAVSRARYARERKQDKGESLEDIAEQLADVRSYSDIEFPMALRRVMKQERDVETRLITFWTLIGHKRLEISDALNVSPKTLNKRLRNFVTLFRELRP